MKRVKLLFSVVAIFFIKERVSTCFLCFFPNYPMGEAVNFNLGC